eukprot:gb/GECG01010068.1/.p1 GENE.gb/GECG01010068.1/~~gb/GECG01010068.1/.p1  ORF type:complete len:1007 (+),score=110.76 gb/GECG01010068.1/:1-3021(+)
MSSEAWNCAKCTFTNDPSDEHCAMCENPRDDETTPFPSGEDTSIPVAFSPNRDSNMYHGNESRIMTSQSDSDESATEYNMHKESDNSPGKQERRPPPPGYSERKRSSSNEAIFNDHETSDVESGAQRQVLYGEEEGDQDQGDPWVAAQVKFTQVQEELLCREYLFFEPADEAFEAMATYYDREETFDFADAVLLKAVRILVKQSRQQARFRQHTANALGHATMFTSRRLQIGDVTFISTLSIILNPKYPFWQDTVIYTSSPNTYYFETLRTFVCEGLPPLCSIAAKYVEQNIWPGSTFAEELFEVFNCLLIVLKNYDEEVSCLRTEYFDHGYLTRLMRDLLVICAELSEDRLKSEDPKTLVSLTEQVLKEKAISLEFFDRFKMSLVKRMLLCQNLAKRLWALDELNHLSKNIINNAASLSEEDVIKGISDLKEWLEGSTISIIEELVGPKMHAQLVERSLPLIRRFAYHNAIAHHELRTVWDAVLRTYHGTASESASLQRLFVTIIESGKDDVVTEGFRLLEGSLNGYYKESVSSLAKLFDSVRFSGPHIPNNDEHLIHVRLADLCWSVLVHNEAPSPMNLRNKEVDTKAKGIGGNEQKNVDTCMDLLVRVIGSLASEHRWFCMEEAASDMNITLLEPFMQIIHRCCQMFQSSCRDSYKVVRCLFLLESSLKSMQCQCIALTEGWLKPSAVLLPTEQKGGLPLFPGDQGYNVDRDFVLAEYRSLYNVDTIDENLFARLLSEVERRTKLFQCLMDEMESYVRERSQVDVCFLRPRLGFLYTLMRHCSDLTFGSEKTIRLWQEGLSKTWRSKLCFWEWVGHMCGQTILDPTSVNARHVMDVPESEIEQFERIQSEAVRGFLSDNDVAASDKLPMANNSRENVSIDGTTVDSICDAVTENGPGQLPSPAKSSAHTGFGIETDHFFSCTLESSIGTIQSMKNVLEERDSTCTCENCRTARCKLSHWWAGNSSGNEGSAGADRYLLVFHRHLMNREKRVQTLFFRKLRRDM